MSKRDFGNVGPSCPWPQRNTGRRWCIVQTEYRREATAEAEIKDAGYLAYVPRFKTRVRDASHRRWIDVRRPLFTGYVFADVGEGVVPWGRLATLRGVRDLVRSADAPVRLPDQVIARLRFDEGENFGQPYRKPVGDLVPIAVNDRVRIVDGPFTGFYATVAYIDGRNRITAFIDFLGGVSKLDGLTADQVDLTEQV